MGSLYLEPSKSAFNLLDGASTGATLLGEGASSSHEAVIMRVHLKASKCN